LRQIADKALRSERGTHDVVAADTRGPRAGREKPGDHLHGGGLAGTVRPEKPQHFTAVYGEADTVDGRERAEALGEIFDDDHGRTVRASRWTGSDRRIRVGPAYDLSPRNVIGGLFSSRLSIPVSLPTTPRGGRFV